ncbi:MAG: polysaccharide deacetylase family protein [Defluviimonas sp.]|uniref:polysaccharide deacetylase family protein n=1 Tax=Albidovulum sp. TaxID=1872424 RepID=UPI001D6A5ED2|nr:polysaccharide deacetylase family protein [Paracoccaceae bacterium]MCC0064597.1 polysaccharide deacetylase family protein [Defluviimonas sp.]
MAAPVVDILMYHSISNRGGATSIPPAVFAEQMAALARSELPVITLDDLVAAREGRGALAPHSVIITFDDGFQDFANAAWPVLQRHGLRPMVYLPTSFVGRAEGWRGIADPPRALMGWATIRALAREGVAFGSHTVTHAELDTLSPEALEAELVTARTEIEDRLGHPVRHFAPPYGIAGPAVRARIAESYHSSVGTRLGRAGPGADVFDLPRLEMFYFTSLARWRAHLAGRGEIYLRARAAMRAARGALVKPWRGV